MVNPLEIPNVPPINCGDCDPWNPSISQQAFSKAFFDGLSYNWQMCLVFGENFQGEPATEVNCGKGFVNIKNNDNKIGTYIYQGYSESRPFELHTELVFISVLTSN